MFSRFFQIFQANHVQYRKTNYDRFLLLHPFQTFTPEHNAEQSMRRVLNFHSAVQEVITEAKNRPAKEYRRELILDP